MTDPRFSIEALYDQFSDVRESQAEVLDQMDRLLAQLDQQTTAFQQPAIED